MENIEVRFWGVRGSVPTPGPETARVGGNTSCVEVRCGDERLILDAGTGLRSLGQRCVAEGPLEATLLLSHLHWDHIQGLPFFAPMFMSSTRLQIMGPSTPEEPLSRVLAQQMRPPTFPIRWDDLPAHLAYRGLRHGQRIRIGSFEVRVAKLNHPGGGVLAYRVEAHGRSVVYATDTEHYECVDPTLAKLALGADVLVYDAMYTPEEYRGEVGMAKVGWGHSTFEAGAEVAEAAGVGELVLFHHDPTRDDDAVDAIVERARERFADTRAAREGLRLELSPRGEVAAA